MPTIGRVGALQSVAQQSATAQRGVPITFRLGGRELDIEVPAGNKRQVREALREYVRQEKSHGARAGNSANTAQQIGIVIGGPLTVGGGIAALTVAAPLVLGAAIAAGIGALVTIGGLATSHWMTNRRIEHEENIDRVAEAVEDLR